LKLQCTGGSRRAQKHLKSTFRSQIEPRFFGRRSVLKLYLVLDKASPDTPSLGDSETRRDMPINSCHDCIPPGFYGFQSPNTTFAWIRRTQLPAYSSSHQRLASCESPAPSLRLAHVSYPCRRQPPLPVLSTRAVSLLRVTSRILPPLRAASVGAKSVQEFN
jgi:hypothetical protein